MMSQREKKENREINSNKLLGTHFYKFLTTASTNHNENKLEEIEVRVTDIVPRIPLGTYK